jgi:hypothetical protein
VRRGAFGISAGNDTPLPGISHDGPRSRSGLLLGSAALPRASTVCNGAR